MKGFFPYQDNLAEWSKALASGASPQGRGFDPHSCHFFLYAQLRTLAGMKEIFRAQSMLGSVRFSCFENLLSQVEFSHDFTCGLLQT